MRQSSAFTMIELLIVVGLLGILSTSAFINVTRARDNQYLKSDTEEVADVLRQAHVFARESRDQMEWGVSYESVNHYSLVSRLSSYETAQVKNSFFLERGNSFTANFNTIWFIKNEGGTTVNREIEIRNIHGRSQRILITIMGVIEVVQGL